MTKCFTSRWSTLPNQPNRHQTLKSFIQMYFTCCLCWPSDQPCQKKLNLPSDQIKICGRSEYFFFHTARTRIGWQEFGKIKKKRKNNLCCKYCRSLKQEGKKEKKSAGCSDDLTPSRCVNFYVVATLLARLAHTNSEPSQVVCVCQRNVWQRGKNISPAG